ncbi:MAG: uracil-DNA glycosylase [Cytophagaceae bacterium]|nr:uracil-DNA glycosylase [Cytophagaceae bacterium]
MEVQIEDSWKQVLAPEFEKPYFKKLVDFIKSERQQSILYPPGPLIFKAFEACPLEQVKVVIIGQDPYHGPGQANGLCFSVSDGQKLPPSLQNIFKEIHRDLGKPIPTSGNLERWAQQGVLLLNATLTVRAHSPGSHQHQGWEIFTDAVIQVLSATQLQLVFLLWGSYAQQKGSIIDSRKHLILQSPHPSPFSAHRGFLGNSHFSKTNDYLTSHGKSAIDW